MDGVLSGGKIIDRNMDSVLSGGKNYKKTEIYYI